MIVYISAEPMLVSRDGFDRREGGMFVLCSGLACQPGGVGDELRSSNDQSQAGRMRIEVHVKI